MALQVIPLAFWAETREGAEAQALAWAAREPNIESARIADARNTHRDRWTVDLDVTLRSKPGEPQQEGFGL